MGIEVCLVCECDSCCETYEPKLNAFDYAKEALISEARENGWEISDDGHAAICPDCEANG